MVICKQCARTLSALFYLIRLAIKILQLLVAKCSLLGLGYRPCMQNILQFTSRFLTVEKFEEGFFPNGSGLELIISAALTVLLLVGSVWVIYRSHLSPLQGNKGRAGFASLSGRLHWATVGLKARGLARVSHHSAVWFNYCYDCHYYSSPSGTGLLYVIPAALQPHLKFMWEPH